MTCKVCRYDGQERAKNVNGVRICSQCGMPMVPQTQNMLDAFRAKWARMKDDIINGHRHGTWGDDIDVPIAFEFPRVVEDIGVLVHI